MTPFCKKNGKAGQAVNTPLPCGKCPNCLKKRVSSWSFRLLQEYKISHSAHFVTLTYDTRYVPITKNGFMGLCPKDLQDFFKRIRYYAEAPNIKYYACGEYGGKTYRPHYHVILFNADTNDVINAWQKGSPHFGTVNAASVGYTLKYISKTKRIPLHANDDRVPEFARMSKGLGLSYIAKRIVKTYAGSIVLDENGDECIEIAKKSFIIPTSMVSWHHADLDNRMYVPIEDGKKISMPRYYKERIYTEQERKRIGFLSRVQMISNLEKEMSENPNYHHDKAESDKAAFRRMNHKANQGTKF